MARALKLSYAQSLQDEAAKLIVLAEEAGIQGPPRAKEFLHELILLLIERGYQEGRSQERIAATPPSVHIIARANLGGARTAAPVLPRPRAWTDQPEASASELAQTWVEEGVL